MTALKTNILIEMTPQIHADLRLAWKLLEEAGHKNAAERVFEFTRQATKANDVLSDDKDEPMVSPAPYQSVPDKQSFFKQKVLAVLGIIFGIALGGALTAVGMDFLSLAISPLPLDEVVWMICICVCGLMIALAHLRFGKRKSGV